MHEREVYYKDESDILNNIRIWKLSKLESSTLFKVSRNTLSQVSSIISKL